MENLSASSLWTTKINFVRRRKRRKKIKTESQRNASTPCNVQCALFMFIQNKEQTNYFTRTTETKFEFNSEREIRQSIIIYYNFPCIPVCFNICLQFVQCVVQCFVCQWYGSLSYFLCFFRLLTPFTVWIFVFVFFILLCWFNLPMAYDLLKL